MHNPVNIQWKWPVSLTTRPFSEKRLTCLLYIFWCDNYLHRDDRISCYDEISQLQSLFQRLCCFFFSSRNRWQAHALDLDRKQTLTSKLPYTILVQTRTISMLIVACSDICLYSFHWTFPLISHVISAYTHVFLMMMSARSYWCILTNSRWCSCIFSKTNKIRVNGKIIITSRQKRLKQTTLIEHLSWLTSNEKEALNAIYTSRIDTLLSEWEREKR